MMVSVKPRRLAVWSWWMLPAFAVWSVLFILLSEPMLRLVFGFTPSEPGDTFYVEAWGPWIAITVLWLAPVAAGLVLAALAVRGGAGKLAVGALVVHGLFPGFTVPNVVERLLTL